jgi:hypothetical protein
VRIPRQARGLIERAAAAVFHDPQVGRGVFDQPDTVEDIAAVDAVHHQHDREQHAHAHDGGEELAEVPARIS